MVMELRAPSQARVLRSSDRPPMVIDVSLPSVLDSPRKPLIVAAIAGVAGIAIFTLWATVMSVASGAVAQGKIIVEGNRKAIQHRDGGPVAAVLVREGQKVDSGQPLLELDLSDTRAEFKALTSSRLIYLARAVRLRTEAANAETIKWPAELLRPNDPQLTGIREQEQSAFAARLTAHRQAIDLQQQQIDGSTQQIAGLKGRKAATNTQFRSVENELESIRPLEARGLIARPRITSLERAAAGFQGELETIQNSIAAEQTKVLTAKGQIELLEKQRKESISNDLSEAETRLADIEPRLAGAKEKLARSVLVAPEAGFVFNLQVFSPGAVLTPGQTVMEIVPAGDPLVLQIDIDPKDAERVQPGQNVVIHLLPYNQRYQAKINGTLLKISADRIDEPDGKRSYFRGIVRVDKNDLARTGDTLMPGMPASAVVETGDRPILAYLLDPVFRITNFAMRER